MAFQEMPAYVEQSLDDQKILRRALHGGPGGEYDPGENVTVASSLTDSRNTPTTTLLEGYCIVKDTGTGDFYAADGATGDRNTGAYVDSVVGDGNSWKGATITVNFNGGADQVFTLQAGTATIAAAVTDLNTNAGGSVGAAFAAQFIASSVGGKLRIKTLQAGADQYLNVKSSYTAAYTAAAGLSGQGVDAKYLVTMGQVRLLDRNGAATKGNVKTAVAGWFNSANLVHTTPECLATLRRNGSKFD